MKRNGGFSLVELMVAMVIGLIIILGAGQLFLTVFQTNRQVETLGEKQAAVNFAVEGLLRDVRRANHDPDPWDDENSVLTLNVPNRSDVSDPNCSAGESVEKEYGLNPAADDVFLHVAVRCNGEDKYDDDVVGGFVVSDGDGNPGFDVDDSDWSDGILKITLRLVPTDGSGDPDVLTFVAVNRTAAVGGGSSNDNNGNGNNGNGNNGNGNNGNGNNGNGNKGNGNKGNGNNG